jgi:hypothetical protein
VTLASSASCEVVLPREHNVTGVISMIFAHVNKFTLIGSSVALGLTAMASPLLALPNKIPNQASKEPAFTNIQKKGDNLNCRCVFLSNPGDVTKPGSPERRQKCWERFKCGL